MNLQNFLTDTINNGGASFNITTGVYNPKNGYFVSLPNHEQQIPLSEFKASDLKRYVNNNYDVLSNENNFVGSWVDNGMVYLDISEKITDKRTALVLGIDRNQKAIYDAFNGKVIDIPTPQKAGTLTQQKTYLKLTIDNLCK